MGLAAVGGARARRPAGTAHLLIAG
jgi:hypothetical protein